MSDPTKNFVEPMLSAFEQPPGSDAAKFFAALTEDLQQFSDDALQAGARKMRVNRKYRSFPTIAECLDAVRTASAADYAPKSSASAKPAGFGHGTADAQREWDQKLEAFLLCRCALGRQAKREGWLVAMFDHCRETGRLPHGAEIDACSEMAELSRAGLEELRGTPVFRSMAKLRENMIARREKEIFGGEWKDA